LIDPESKKRNVIIVCVTKDNFGTDDRGVLLRAPFPMLGSGQESAWRIFECYTNTLFYFFRPYLRYWVRDVTIIMISKISTIRIQGQKTRERDRGYCLSVRF